MLHYIIYLFQAENAALVPLFVLHLQSVTQSLHLAQAILSLQESLGELCRLCMMVLIFVILHVVAIGMSHGRW